MADLFTCAACGGTFEKGWSDAEANAERERLFAEPVERCVLVCDDCFKEIMAWQAAEAR